MGWKGTVRSLQAASRRMERDAEKRRRELQKQQKAYARMAELEQAEYEVDVWNNYIDVLQSIHKGCGDSIDWLGIDPADAPAQPIFSGNREEKARQLLQSYKPGYLSRLLKIDRKKKQKLNDAIEEAKKHDQEDFNSLYQQWQQDFAHHERLSEIAAGVLKGQPQARINAIEYFAPFDELSELGSSIHFCIDESSGVLQVTLNVHGETLIPSEIKSLLKSGKLSVKKMPIGKRNELLQDYICSCILRVARELFNLLSDDMVIVTAVDKLLNTATGYQEEQPILSVAVTRKALDKLNMDTIDPSDSMVNFVHHMNFKKTTGFGPVQAIEPRQFAG
ncbi:hypothetical protein [Citrobacter portucalensis]|uniref:hypothetical protein n=1 Tax=Citrobacter portucalensis TaxID=1639133 RepID=UPI0039F51BD4